MRGLYADAKNALEVKEFPPSYRRAVLANLRPERLSRHEECPSKAVGGLFIVDIRSNIKKHVSNLMRDSEALTFAPVASIDNYDGRHAAGFTTNASGESIDIREAHGKDLDATFLC